MLSSALYSRAYSLQESHIQRHLLRVAAIKARTLSEAIKYCAPASTASVPGALATKVVVFGHELSEASLMGRTVKGQLPYT